MIRLKNKDNQEVEDAINKMQDLERFVVKGDEKTTTLNLDTATLGEITNVLATLIKALQRGQILG